MKRWLVISAFTVFIISGSLLLDSCKKPKHVTSNPIQFVVPPGFPQPTYNFSANPLTQEGFLLGRKLFYDTKLSADLTVSCGTCHQPSAAFTTFEHDRSHGVNHTHTLRNAPGLFNLAWYPYFMQDGSAKTHEEVYEKHISSPTELGETVPNIMLKLKEDPSYKFMFRAAFGSDDVTPDRMYKALTQFLITMVSADSKYDKVLQGKASFNTQEQNGAAVFAAKCASCHSGGLFTDFSFRNIGLPVDLTLNDHGRKMVTGLSSDSLKFRVPSLRNLEFTSYYMHDGRFNLPRNAVRHYRTGVQQSATLDPLLTNGIQMTQQEEDDLVQFLRTLSDSAFLNNTRYR